MTDREILEQAITKAVGSGYSPFSNKFKLGRLAHHAEGWMSVVFDVWVEDLSAFDADKWVRMEIPVNHIIFNHDFATALWGSQPYRIGDWKGQHSDDDEQKGMWAGPNWQHHLRMMVIDSDPLRYLGENI